MPLARWKDLCLDTTDTSATAEFWAAALDLRFEPRSEAVTLLRGSRPEQATWVNLVPEPKTVKNRVHLDVRAPDDRPGSRQQQVAEFIANVVAWGGSKIRDVIDDGGHFAVMQDPEGNEFCTG